jgi:hypothetical protein
MLPIIRWPMFDCNDIATSVHAQESVELAKYPAERLPT